MILLDSGSFVVDVERGDHSISDDPSTKESGSGFNDGAVKDELYLRIAAFLGVINRAFFLRLANEYHALPLVEGFPLLFGEIVFPLSFGKSDQGNLVVLGEALNRVTNRRLMGSTMRVEATLCPRWMRMNFKVPLMF